MRSKEVRIFQPFHDELSREFIDPGAIAVDWTHNPTPKLREAAIYLHIQSLLDPLNDDYVGVFSPKFAIKAGVSLEHFISFVKSNPGYDVYFINPFPQLAYLSFNVWDQGEISHPGIIDIAKKCFQEAGIASEDVFDVRNDHRSMAYCNFWVGSPRFLQYYIKCLEALIGIKDTTLQNLLFENTTHDLGAAPFFPFIVERMFSTIVASNRHFSYLNYEFSEQEILNRSGEEQPVVRKNMPIADEMDRENKWTAEFRAEVIQHYLQAERSSLERYARLGLPFDLKKWQGQYLPTLKHVVSQ